jgi:hypothetical protein
LATERARAGRVTARVLALLLCACAPALLEATPASMAPARSFSPGEVEVEAAYLVNFLRYTQWPSARVRGPGAALVVSVVGSQAAADSVRAVCAAANGFEGRGIDVRWLPQARGSREAPFDSAQDAEARAQLRNSHLVFFHRSSGKVHPQVLSDLVGLPVLTVSDNNGFTQQGGMLGLVRSDRRIVFQANTGAIRGAGLLVSAKVLKLARANARSVP